MQPAPFILEKPLEDLYQDWESLWLKANAKLPDSKTDFVKDFDEELDGWRDEVTPEWFEALEPYISSGLPQHKVFTLWVLSWYATDWSVEKA